MARVRMGMLGMGVLAAALTSACFGGQNTAAEEQQRALSAAKTKRQELLGKVRATTPEVANQCEVSDGDCLILVGEKRETLFRPSAACGAMSDVYEREDCQANALAKEGKVPEVTEFYQYENWCLERLVACSSERLEKARESELLAMQEERRQALLKSTDVAELALQIAFARERVAYLRSTLPKTDDTACSELPEVRSCRDKALGHSKELTAELNKETSSYRAEQAAQLFRSEMTVQAGCFEPEYVCLEQHVKALGENKESKRHLERNLKLIKERESLIPALPQPVVQECLNAAEADYGQAVESAHGRYAKQPNTLFRVLLHQAHVKLHSAQIKCLKHAAK